VHWDPTPTTEGNAIAIHLLQPKAGRQVATVVATLRGRPVPFGRIGGQWLGFAALPIGEAGPGELSLHLTLADDSAVEQRISIQVQKRAFSSTRLRVAPDFSSPPPETRVRIDRERELIRGTLARVTPEWLLNGDFRPPRRLTVTSPFGQRRLFNGELRSRHTGVDLRGRLGDPVRAAGRGLVALTGAFYYSGNAVYIDHGLGVYTGYFHLSKILVHEGDEVETGEVIGEVGATGRVTAPHLHWSLFVGGISLDARSLLGIRIPATD